MLANYKIESSNYILRIASKDKGRLLLQNKQSETLVQLGELKLGRWPQLELEKWMRQVPFVSIIFFLHQYRLR